MNGRPKNWLRGGALFSLLEVALVAALAATAAYWTWALAAPAAVASSAHATPARADPDSAMLRQGLFGAPQRAATGLKLRLVGLASPARAVFVLENGKSATARAGEAIAPGAVLRAVHPDHALVERNGVLERVALERRNAAR
jgi:hypothetical protein